MTVNFRTIVSMNNIGTRLLERRAYQQAFEILKDAVSIFDILFRVGNTDSSTLVGLAMEKKYKDAVKKYADPQETDMPTLEVEAVSHNWTNACIDKILHPEGLPFRNLFPIRIEDIDIYRDYGNDSDFTLRFLILLHNFGIAHLCIAFASADIQSVETVTAESRRATDLHMKGVELLRTVLQSYCDILSTQSISDIEKCERYHHVILALNSLAVAKTVFGQGVSGQGDEQYLLLLMMNHVEEIVQGYVIWNVVAGRVLEHPAPTA